MNWTEVISIILGSSVLSTLFQVGYSYLSNRKLKDDEMREKLYSPVRFYLMMMENNAKTRKELLDSRQKADKIANWIDPDNKRMNKFNADNKELILNWWTYARKVLQSFENSPQYIKKEHWPLVEKIFATHLFRKMVSGEDVYKDTWGIYDDHVFEKDNANEFIEELKKFYNVIR